MFTDKATPPPGKSWHTFIMRMSRAWRSAAKLLSKDEARRIAVNIAKLPQLLGAQEQ